MSPRAALIAFDSIIIGIALSLGVEEVTTKWRWSVLMTAAAFFVPAVNFFHSKLNLLIDNDYQTYADSRHPAVQLADFLLHIILLGTFAFMPHFLTSAAGFLAVSMAMRLAGALFALLVARSAKNAPLPAGHKARIVRSHSDWLVSDTVILLSASALLGLVQSFPNAPGLATTAVGILLALTIGEILADYALHRAYYFAARPAVGRAGSASAPDA